MEPLTIESMHSEPIEEVSRMPVVEGGQAWGEKTREPQSEAKPQSTEPNWVHCDLCVARKVRNRME